MSGIIDFLAWDRQEWVFQTVFESLHENEGP